MRYRKSTLDDSNLKWFEKNDSVQSLKRIHLEGNLRGLHDFDIEFKYPISAIAGKNGSGKTTILAMVACAYHNLPRGHRLTGRRVPYYTFSDFFIQSVEDVAPDGIKIGYYIHHNNWKVSGTMPTGKGVGRQERTKRKGGKWNRYQGRVKRNVAYMGIDRVVPHSEKSVAKSYRAHFSHSTVNGWEDDVREVVARILNKKYEDLKYLRTRYLKLPVVACSGQKYSGFNMGAGENALFEIFANIYTFPEGSIFIIDEIELGLHEEAQVRLIEELKKVCEKRKIQIVCTTHSATILAQLPPEARFYVQNSRSKTTIITGISPDYAAGKMKGKGSSELDIYVEDTIAKAILESALKQSIRERINITPVGSDVAVVQQLAARYKDSVTKDAIAIIDGDKRPVAKSLNTNFENSFQNKTQKEKAKVWVTGKICFLPSEETPEKWMLKTIKKTSLTQISKALRIDEGDFEDLIDESILQPKHKELYYLSEKVGRDIDFMIELFATHSTLETDSDFDEIRTAIKSLLE